ncbi:MAG: DNA phosphorothioation system sulfurtransferase DndC [Proteobacteria bacterium]|nr:DNA phosphorothioation system sulfurtransferase DndC [Pseudomonadota bacterium]
MQVVQIKTKVKKSVLAGDLAMCQQQLSEEYDKQHEIPWIVCFSGGKDSTLLLQLTLEMLLEKKKKGYSRREIHVVANDTLVESPLIIEHLDGQLRLIKKFSREYNLPVKVVKTTPSIDSTFWVNLIGRGYASPNRSFRWCTDRLKIKPTNKYIKEQVNENGKVITLLGIRASESRNRRKISQDMESTQTTLRPHKSLVNCMIFSPIIKINDNDLWTILLQRPPPWGGSHRKLITLYRNAQSGRCPTMLDKSDAPMCGGASARFGCWTCTVIENDKSLEGLIDSGEERFQPLVDFRDYLAEIRSKPSSRMKRRRNGRIYTRLDGSAIKGPFTIRTRKLLLNKLEQLQADPLMSQKLISDEEKKIITQIWKKDEKDYKSSTWRK